VYNKKWFETSRWAGPLLFNIVLEYVIRKSNINTEDTFIYKSIQIAAYADDVNIMA
jgi:hypothetical protein